MFLTLFRKDKIPFNTDHNNSMHVMLKRKTTVEYHSHVFDYLLTKSYSWFETNWSADNTIQWSAGSTTEFAIKAQLLRCTINDNKPECGFQFLYSVHSKTISLLLFVFSLHFLKQLIKSFVLTVLLLVRYKY